MRTLFVLLFLLPIFGLAQINQTDGNGLRQGLWQKKQANGKLIYEGHFKNGKPVGEWKRYHDGGQLKATIVYRTTSDSADTRLFDVWGKKIAEGIYLNEKKAARWSYFSNGRKISDEVFANGIKNGLARKFYDTGEVMETVEWKNGEQHGKYQVFFKNGQPFMQYKMANNSRHGLFLTFFPDGKRELEAGYKNGLRHGDWKYFDTEGNLRYTLQYDNGELLNPKVKDSIENLQLQKLDLNRDKLIDPEKYIDDPAEYMRKMNGIKQ